jgi:hypothetical protein
MALLLRDLIRITTPSPTKPIRCDMPIQAIPNLSRDREELKDRDVNLGYARLTARPGQGLGLRFGRFAYCGVDKEKPALTAPVKGHTKDGTFYHSPAVRVSS